MIDKVAAGCVLRGVLQVDRAHGEPRAVAPDQPVDRELPAVAAVKMHDAARELERRERRDRAEVDRRGRKARVGRSETDRLDHKMPGRFAVCPVEDGARRRHRRRIGRAVDVAVGDDRAIDGAVPEDADPATAGAVRAAAADSLNPGQQAPGPGDRAARQGEPDPAARAALVAPGPDLAIQNDVRRGDPNKAAAVVLGPTLLIAHPLLS